MNKYTNSILSSVFVLISVFFISCDSEYYTVEGYVSTGGQCEEGQESQKICKDDPDTSHGKIYTCHNQVLTNEESCTNDYSCNGNTCGECINNVDVCENDENNIGYLHKCVSGKRVSNKCEKGLPCNKNGQCGVCANGTMGCVDNSIGVCLDGIYVKYSCSIFGFDASTTCKSLDGLGINLFGCLGINGNELGCYQDDKIGKAYRVKWGDTFGAKFDSICPTAKCNADNSGCENDPVVEPSQGE